MSIFSKFFNFTNQRVISDMQPQVKEAENFEIELQKLTDKQLREVTEKLKDKLAKANGDQEREKELLSQILPEAFALVREATKRVWGERHFDVQMIGGMVLHQGKIAEMKTGEGKTIVAALPLFLNALTGRGAHLVTVNDYLAKHQGEGMGEVFNFLGLSTGIIQSNQESFRFKKTRDYKHYSECEGANLESCSRKDAYSCDITYGTNNEYGFDYLRDNMAPSVDQCSQRELNYAIVDEVDSILIDEARTPLIISAPAAESAGMYQQFSALIPKLKAETDFVIDEKDRVVTLTDAGIKKIEGLLNIKNIYATDGITMVHHLEQALKAEALFKKDKDYIVKDGEIIIVDEFTGRLMVGRRYSEGLHQAIEAKENVEVKQESQTMATISFQNLFRLYNKLAGMTGTAATEAEEFYKIYKLDVTEIPTNKPIVRQDFPDKIFKSEEGKLSAIVEEIQEKQKKGQPVLVGTVSVTKNELLAKLLKKAGVKFEILNAKNHLREAKIVAKAGQKGAVMVATNMAGRGTDIKLGEGVVALGGLHVIGTERHESRRIDNQLRGRAGRQGDPGSSQFFVSMDDDLMRIFGGEKMKGLMNTLGLPEDMPIENKMISRSIESAQRKVEGHNFDIRKHLVEYDDVMNKHREVIYRKRRAILENKESEGKNIKEEIIDILGDEVEGIVNNNIEDQEKAKLELGAIIGSENVDTLVPENLKEKIKKIYQEREEKYGEEISRQIEKAVFLRTIDLLWVEHLTTMDELRTGISLRGYGQRDPLVEYKQEAYLLFQSLLKTIESNVAKTILKVEVQLPPTQPITRRPLEYKAPDPDQIGDPGSAVSSQQSAGKQPTANSQPQTSSDVTTVIREKGKSVFDRMAEGQSGPHSQIKSNKKVGRNDPCPCGSGKKYKKCCGK